MQNTTDIRKANELMRLGRHRDALSIYEKIQVNNPVLEKAIQVNIEICHRRVNKTSKQVASLNSTEKLVDIIVPVHNAPEDVNTCIQSLIKHTPKEKASILLIDDQSTCADTRRLILEIKAASNPIQVIINDENYGYTKTANAGLRRTTSPYVVLLNSDTIVSTGWVERMLEVFERYPKTGIVGPWSNAASWQNIPQLFDDDGSFAINQINDHSAIKEIGSSLNNQRDHLNPSVPFINGFCMMISRDLINTIGYLDEDSFPTAYGEENDYCIRAADAGFELRIATKAYVYHSKSKSFGNRRRIELSRQGDNALRAKHGNEKIELLLNKISSCAILKECRARAAAAIKNELPIIQHMQNATSILYLLPAGAGGGGGHSVIQEAVELRKMGIDVRIAVINVDRDKFIEIYRDVHEIEKLLVGFHSPEHLAKQIATKAQICIATIYSSLRLLKLICKWNPGILPFYYVQDYEPFFFQEGSADWKEAVESYTLIKDCFLFAKTQWLCSLVESKHGITVHKVAPSIDHDIYTPNLRNTSNAITISAMVRVDSPRRSPAETLNLLKRLKLKAPNMLSIHIFGSTDSDIDKLGCGSWKTFATNHGILSRNEVASVLRHSDIFIDLSTYQAFGRTALEAMACGAVAVVPDKCGCAEYAKDDINAIVFQKDKHNILVERLLKLISNPQELSRLKEHALMTASSYSVKSAATSLLSVFNIKSPSITAPRRRKRVAIMPSIQADGNPVGSAYVRLLDTYPNALNPEYYDVKILDYGSFPMPGTFDVLIVQRELDRIPFATFKKWARLWKLSGGKIVIDIDDNLFDERLLSVRLKCSVETANEYKERFQQFAKECDTVTTSMPYLNELVSSIHSNYIHIPNVLSTKRWWIGNDAYRPSGNDCYKRKEGDPIRIGYIGTPTHDQDLMVVKDAISMIQSEYGTKVEIEVIGAYERSLPLFGNKVSLPKQTSYPNFVEWLGKRVHWDIGIIPLVDDAFNRAKSYLKFLEYSALGLAIACSDVETYSYIARHGSNCLVSKNTTEDWYATLKTLIETPELRKQISINAAREVANSHTISNCIDLYEFACF